jgi:hypothetical protein
MNQSFSERHPHIEPEVPITVREDAPQALRDAIPRLAEQAGLSWSTQREIVCDVLLRAPDRDNWSEWPNIAYEVMRLINECPWWQVYDIVERYWEALGAPSHGEWSTPNTHRPNERQSAFAEKLNRVFRLNGIGWVMQPDGTIETRGEPLTQTALTAAQHLVREAGWSNTVRELEQAHADLSRRPEPDVTGVIQHASAALESVVRQITGSSQTLGQAAKQIDYSRYPPVLRDVLQTALSKLYGYASSDQGGGRHGSEAIQVDRADAALFLGMVGCAIEYLVAKQ